MSLRLSRIARTCAWIFLVAELSPLGASPVPAAPFAYVATLAPAVVVIDTASNTVVTTIPFPAGTVPRQLAATPDGKRVYVTSQSFPGRVLVIDAASNTLVGPPITLDDGSDGIAITPDGRFAYVANFFGNTVSVIATETDTVVSTIAVGFLPTGLAITPSGRFVYVANGGAGTMSVIDTTTNTVVASPGGVGGLPEGVSIAPDGRKVYVTSLNSHAVSVIDTTTNTVQKTIPVGFFPLGIVMTPDGTRVYVADNDPATNSGSIAVIDPTTEIVTTRVNLPPFSVPRMLAATPDGTRVYVTINTPRQVVVIDTATNTIVGAPLTLAAIPHGIAISLDSGAPSLVISPPSGRYVATQVTDLVLIFTSSSLSISGGRVTFDGNDVTGALLGCFVPGTLAAGGQTLRCPGLTGDALGTGLHTLDVTLNLSNGSTVSDRVTWQVLSNTEP